MVGPAARRFKGQSRPAGEGPSIPAAGGRQRRCYPEMPEPPFPWLEARPGSDTTMARTKFTTPEALIVISTDGYFDVYP
jgi:hypothetical protein